MQNLNYILGIDYGAKLAGTTVIAYIRNNQITFLQSTKKQDADILIQKFIAQNDVHLIGLDAPLSLPQIYTNPTQGTDYFYRMADKLLGAMSPMFLGGLTARAMQLSAYCKKKGIDVIEVYPAAIAKRWDLEQFEYKKSFRFISQICDVIQEKTGYSFSEEIHNWHQIDAVLALASAIRYNLGKADSFGDVSEGVIWV